MKHLWEKAGTEVLSNGGKCIRYTCEDFPGISVFSDTVFKPHASGGGGWLYHSYSVATSWGFGKMFRTLKEAKAFVENGGMGHVNKEEENERKEHDGCALQAAD